MSVQFEWDDSALTGLIKAGEQGLNAAGEHILAESLKVVPREESTLARSGQVSQDGLDVAVSYDTVYAARQHEELDWQHRPGQQAKYLEQPLQQNAEKAVQIIGDTISKALS
ncbi:hypothetical protein ACFSYH_01940 [Populibacterium corticicola]|uniref:HK97 gp10 family phage protein n=1 Tax=Populibacterium corticicola TaxID=1812826 RepID=A0ABW5XB82_9MICO